MLLGEKNQVRWQRILVKGEMVWKCCFKLPPKVMCWQFCRRVSHIVEVGLNLII